MARVFISYKHVEPDLTVAHALSTALDGIHEVFIDTKIPLGATWGNVIEESLGQADWIIALVSAKSATSAMVVTEIETAHRLNVERGRPILIPIRLGDIGALHYPLSAYMSRFQQAEWRTDADTPMLVRESWRRSTLRHSDARSLPSARHSSPE